MWMSTNCRTYDAEFKKNAVSVAAEAGKTVSEVAAGLGVAANLVYRWRREVALQGGLSFPGQGEAGIDRAAAQGQRAGNTAPGCGIRLNGILRSELCVRRPENAVRHPAFLYTATGAFSSPVMAFVGSSMAAFRA